MDSYNSTQPDTLEPGEPFPGLFDALRRRTSNPRYFPGYNHLIVTEVGLDHVVGELEVQENSLNVTRSVHGGAILTLADTLCGVAAATRGVRSTTLDCSMNFLRPGREGGRVICTVTPEKVGKTIAVYNAVVTDETGAKLATGRFSFYILGPLTPKAAQKQTE